MPTTTPAPPTEAAEPDGIARYRLGNAALILAWLAGLAIVGYSIGSDASYMVRVGVLVILSVPLMVRLFYYMVRLLRKKPPTSDASMITEGGPWQDERHQRLGDKAGHFAGAVSMVVPVLFMTIGAEVAALAGVTIVSMNDWMVLGLGVANATLMTHTLTFILAARYYSRKG